MVDLGFSKKERIVSQKLIDTLFGGGNSHALTAFPLRVVYMLNEHPDRQEPVEVLISVPKRRFHHAVDRNRVKRQVRESYRLQKSVVTRCVPQDKSLAIAFVWIGDRHLPTSEISDRVRNLLGRIAKKL